MSPKETQTTQGGLACQPEPKGFLQKPYDLGIELVGKARRTSPGASDFKKKIEDS